MKVRLIKVPYDAGQFVAGLGLGPVALERAGLSRRLTEAGHDVTETTVLLDEPTPREISTGFAVATAIASACRDAASREQFPLVIAGNCLSALGVCAGIGADAALWFDAHGDMNTPQTTTSGRLDGMALSALLGRCWQNVAAGVPGFTPLAAERVALVDGRDLDASEIEEIADAGLRRIEVSGAREAAVGLIAAGARTLYLHLDLDVHAPVPAPGGPSAEAVRAAVTGLAAAAPLAGAALTAYDPSLDPDGAMAAAAVDLAAALVEAVAERRVVQALNSAIGL